VLKTVGYLISTLSVMLLSIVSWTATDDDPVLRACLVAGVLASVAGMYFRWLSFRRDERPSAVQGRQVTPPVSGSGTPVVPGKLIGLPSSERIAR
jgi:hypothetical protein